MSARCRQGAAALALIGLAACQPQQQRDFVYGPPDAIARTLQAARACGVVSAGIKTLGATAILQIDVATPQPPKTCLRDWVVAHERDVRFPPKL